MRNNDFVSDGFLAVTVAGLLLLCSSLLTLAFIWKPNLPPNGGCASMAHVRAQSATENNVGRNGAPPFAAFWSIARTVVAAIGLRSAATNGRTTCACLILNRDLPARLAAAVAQMCGPIGDRSRHMP